MMGRIVEDDLGEIYRQRGRWFLLLGALLGGIIALATAFGFWLENWGNRLGGGRGEDAHGIAVALAIVLTVVVIVVVLLIWRSRDLLARANRLQPAVLETIPHVSNLVNGAVAAWTSSALGAHTRGSAGGPPAYRTGRAPTPMNRSSRADPRAASELHLKVNTATELTVGSDSSNHTLAEIIQSLESAGIKADGLWSAAGVQGDQVHLIVRGTAVTDTSFKNAGLHVLASRDVVLAEFDDRPGAAADIFRRLTEAGVRVISAQLASSTRMVIISDDPARVIQVLR